MPSILKTKNDERTLTERAGNLRYQWLRHCGARQRQKNLKRLQAEALREQRASCDWLNVTASIPVPDADPPVPDVR